MKKIINLQREKAKRRPELKLELHRHCIVSGPRAYLSGRNEFEHSHEGGNVPHRHPETGPASYTIDKDDWFRATRCQGGGRKKFTDQPKGEQFPLIALTKDETEFEVHFSDPPPDFKGEGAGIMPIANMVLSFGLRPIFASDTRSPQNRRGGRLK